MIGKIFGIILILLALCAAGYVIYIIAEEQELAREFCEEQGYEYDIKCHKIKGDALIEREVVVRKGVAYWKRVE